MSFIDITTDKGRDCWIVYIWKEDEHGFSETPMVFDDAESAGRWADYRTDQLGAGSRYQCYLAHYVGSGT